MQVFARMSPYALGRAACVCRKWRYTIRNPNLWRDACLRIWQVHKIFRNNSWSFLLITVMTNAYKPPLLMKSSGAEANYRIVQSLYDGSWRKMWIQRPRIRNDGTYWSFMDVLCCISRRVFHLFTSLY